MDNFKNKKDKAIRILSEPKDSKLITHLNSCVHCGLCAESCMYYLATNDEKYIPAKKVDIISSIYQRYCTFTGKYFPVLTGSKELDEETKDEMIDLLFGACTLCGRCTKHCSIGVDISYVVRTGRQMLSEMDMVPATLQSTVNAAVQTGNNMSIPTEEFTDTLAWLEDELKNEVNDPMAAIPLNVTNTNILYTLNPREPKFFPLSISAMAKVFYAAKESWTLSTIMYDVTNYAYFTSNNEEAIIIAQRLYDEMLNLNSNRCILAECGHGSRAFRWEAPNYLRKKFPFEVITAVELLAEYISSGRIKLDKELNKEVMTLHDPCNLVREGGVIEQQRYIMKNTVCNFVEMTPHGTENFCCGGGGGQLAMSEYNERRMKIAEIKAEQIRRTGAKVVVTPCHNCVDQLMQIDNKFKLGVKIKTLAEIVADAIILE
ncbi:MAG: (Fe-S)-binding protein [Ignavibacteriae bacterium]|nr:(Fe-S)-binding protein [Ignavibacteriota bacterium]